MVSNRFSYPEEDCLLVQIKSLYGKLNSMQVYSESNFNQLSRRLKVYLDEIRKVASDAASLCEVANCSELEMNSLRLGALRAGESKGLLGEVLYVFQVIQSQCWRLKKEAKAERNAFRMLADKIQQHSATDKSASNPYSGAARLLEEQIIGLEELVRSFDQLFNTISQSVNALFIISKYADSACNLMDNEEYLNSTSSTTLVSDINKDIELCTEDIGRLATHIQMHDLVRQRFEHISMVYEQLLQEVVSIDERSFTPKYLPIVPELARLHIAQVAYAKNECLNTFSSIRDTLNEIDKRIKSALESYVMADCTNKLLDIDFSRSVENFLSESFSGIANSRQEYIRIIGDLQTSISALKIGQLKMRSSITGYLNNTAIPSSNSDQAVCNLDELTPSVSVASNLLLKLKREALQTIEHFTEVAALFEPIVGSFGNEPELLYRSSIYQLYAKKCSCKDARMRSLGVYDEGNLSEAHDKFSEFFMVKVSEVIGDLIKISEQPRMIAHSKELLMQGIRDIENAYTMQSEREVHHKICSAIIGYNSERCYSEMAEYAYNDDNLELF